LSRARHGGGRSRFSRHTVAPLAPRLDRRRFTSAALRRRLEPQVFLPAAGVVCAADVDVEAPLALLEDAFCVLLAHFLDEAVALGQEAEELGVVGVNVIRGGVTALRNVKTSRRMKAIRL
jgi:hypothetical protein